MKDVEFVEDKKFFTKLKPKEKRYKPARYHRVIMFTVFIKKNKTTRVRICRKNNSFNIIKH